MPAPKYHRILLKVGGEALAGPDGIGIDPHQADNLARIIRSVREHGVEIAIVLGAGNLWRGRDGLLHGMERATADHMGMLATVINAIALGEALNNIGSQTRVMSAIDMHKIAEPYIRERAVSHLKKNRIVLVGAGTGNPFFSTDTAAALRAMEIQAEALLKATKVDGIYDSDPEKNPNSKFFSRINYREVLQKNLQVMDMTAVSLAMAQNLPIIVFNLRKKGNIKKVIFGENVGSLISGEAS